MNAVLARALVASALVVLGAGCESSSSPSYQAHDDCPRSIDQYCAQSPCPADWAAATLAGAQCVDGGLSVAVAESCAGYNAIRSAGEDTSTTSFFDVNDGALKAVVDESANFGGSRSCAASVFSSFTPPSCTFQPLPCAPNVDAGADATTDH